MSVYSPPRIWELSSLLIQTHSNVKYIFMLSYLVKMGKVVMYIVVYKILQSMEKN